jgi:hypothetical protein
MERHPHPMHCVRPSLIRWSSSTLWSIRFVHPPERRARSPRVEISAARSVRQKCPVRSLGAKLFQYRLSNGRNLLSLGKTGSLKPLIHFDLASNAEDLPAHVCTQLRRRTRQPTTVASMGLPVSTFC